jgi:L-amino acid N-acyltransferase YncA
MRTSDVNQVLAIQQAGSGPGVGTALLDALISSTEAAGIWTVQTGIFPENALSLRPHQRAGFRGSAAASASGCQRRPLARRVHLMTSR